MKKCLRTLLLTAVFTVLLCGTALAADPNGIVAGTLKPAAGVGNVDLVAQTKDNVPVTEATGTNNVLPNTERVQMTVTPAKTEEHLVFVLKGENQTIPKVDNIVYINQQGGTKNTPLVFNLYPSSLTAGKYTICMSTTSDEVVQVGSFEYYAPYVLGDVDGRPGIESRDAQFVLQHVANLRKLTGNNLLAADVDGRPGVESRDAQFILQHVANLRKLGSN